MRCLLVLPLGLGLAASLASQGVITTIAGTDLYLSQRSLPALSAPLGEVSGGASDAAGNVFFCDRRNNLVLRLSPSSGLLTVVAGNGLTGLPDRSLIAYLPYPPINQLGGDGGPAVNALLNDPTSVAVDTDGTLFIADRVNQRVRRVSPDGTISTYAGGGHPDSGNGDGGLATGASLSEPFGLALDPAGTLYISDVGASSIRLVTRAGVISTFAGIGKAGVAPSGSVAASNPLSYPAHLVFAGGSLYVAELKNQRIARIGPDGILTVVAGSGTQGDGGDGGPALQAKLNNPAGVAVDAAGLVYIADTGNSRVRVVDAQGVIRQFAGTGKLTAGGDRGPATAADLLLPTAVAADGRGNLYTATARSGRLRNVGPDGIIDTVAGNGERSNVGDSGPATEATLSLSLDLACQPYPGYNFAIGTYPSLAADAGGNVYFAEPSANRVRRVTPAGIIETVAGNGTAGSSGDGGPAKQAALNGPIAVATGPNGFLFIIDANNAKMRFVDSAGLIHSGFGIDNNAAFSLQLDQFLFPRDRILIGIKLVSDSNGVLYLAYGSKIYQIPPSGQGITIDPKLTPPGGSNVTYAVAMDGSNQLYVATNRQVFRVALDGGKTLVAGTGSIGNGGDGGPATAATFNLITGIAFDSAGNLYIADVFSAVVRRVTPDGTINRVAGSGKCGSAGDGMLSTDALIDARSLAVDGLGRILIMTSDRIRAVLPQMPQAAASVAALSFAGSAGGAPARSQDVVLTTTIPAVPFTARVEPSSAQWLQLSASSGTTPRDIAVTADPAALTPATYTATIVLDVPNASPPQIRISVTFEVGPSLPPDLAFDRNSLTLFIPRGGGAQTRTTQVLNRGGGQAAFDISIGFNGASGWLSAAPFHANVTPQAPVALAITATPGSLSPGTYTATIALSYNGAVVNTLSITLILSDRDTALSLTQRGLSFTAVQDGGLAPPQNFGVANAGTGRINWSVQTPTESGGAQWLAASSTSGATVAGAAVPTVPVSVQAANLDPGKYYGLATVNSPDAPNSPQVVTVSLQVLPRGSNPGAVLTPGELQFTAVSAGEFPSSQDVFIYNLSAAMVSFRTSVSVSPGTAWLSTVPLQGDVAPNAPFRFTVQPLLRDLFDGSALAAGDYRGEITFQFSDGVVRTLPVRYTVTAAAASTGSAEHVRDSVSTCVPTRLVPSWRSIGQFFGGPGGWPMAMDLDVHDNCGQGLDSGRVIVSFSNADPPVALQPLLGGRWQGTWQTSSRPDNVSVKVDASSADSSLKGTLETPASLSSSQDPPQFGADAVVSVAAPVRFAPLAPRGAISIFGQGLAELTQPASSVPLPTQLGNAQVIIGGRALPIFFASPGQINAVVPEDIPVNTQQQVVLRRGVTLSLPAPVNVAATQPALFADAQGRALAMVFRATGGTTISFPPSPSNPAKAGDTVVFYALALGDVGILPAGNASPSAPPLSVKDAVGVSVGGKDAVVTFAGLAPDFVALYQINVVIPEGVTSGEQVSVTVTSKEQTSPPATISVR